MQWKETAKDLANKSGISGNLSKRIIKLTEILEDVAAEKNGVEFVKNLGNLPLIGMKALDEKNNDELGQLEDIIQHSSNEEIKEILRWYTTFFHLVNSLEQHEISRVNRKREFEETIDSPRKESIAEAVFRMKENGYSYEKALNVFNQMDIQPTITAHPTEARRRSVLLKQQEITSMITRIEDSDIPPDEKMGLENEIKNQLNLLLLTDEIRSERLSVEDEVENGLFYFANSIWESIPVLYEDIRQAFWIYYNELPEIPIVLKYRSWIGSDRDGNPNVTSSVTWNTVLEQRRMVLDLYMQELRSLRSYLSVSDKQIPIPEELKKSVEKDETHFPIPLSYKRRYKHELYRQKVTHIMFKIQYLLDLLDEDKADIITKSQKYKSTDFVEDLEIIKTSLAQNGVQGIAKGGKLKDLIIRAKTFGFHMSALDIRQHSSLHEETVEEILTVARVISNYSDLSEDEKIAVLVKELKNPRPLSPVKMERSETAARVLTVLEEIRDMISLEKDVFGSYIISMTHGISDMLEVMLLAKETGLWSFSGEEIDSSIDIVPLFETIEDLDKSSELMQQLFKHNLYSLHLKSRDNFQEIMLGYSDSNKDGGYWMANWALNNAQFELGRTCRENEINFRLFHGRGGTVGRGGGQSNQAIIAMPATANNGKIRFTEQGEVISFRYSLPAITRRHLEQVVNAVAKVTMEQFSENLGYLRNHNEKQLMIEIAHSSMQAYRALIDDENFWNWYAEVTPVEHIGKLPIASRPVSRGSSGGMIFENLRAIPWVFARTQLRYNVPGWYGIGSGLKVALEKGNSEKILKRWYDEWVFFKTILNNAQREMARTHLATSKLYNGSNMKFHDKISANFKLTVSNIKKITEMENILDHNKVIQQSILFRNPFTHPLNYIQAELLNRWKAADSQEKKDELTEILFLNINGIAAAMQSTG